jgi:hypothetical protein|tara:strand:+ start:51 stop:362 length:312 start_codon:yes stop_codon:yes gene_type:complete
MANGKRNFMTNAKDLRKFNRKRQVVTNTNHIPITTRSVGLRPGYSGGNQVRGGSMSYQPDDVRQPCPNNMRPCGYYWSGDQPGMGERRTKCCDMTNPGTGRNR